MTKYGAFAKDCIVLLTSPVELVTVVIAINANTVDLRSGRSYFGRPWFRKYVSFIFSKCLTVGAHSRPWMVRS